MTFLAFYNVRIGAKIAAALGVLVLIICSTGMFSIERLIRTHDTTTEIHAMWLPSVRYLGDVRYNMARHRAIMSRHVMVTQPGEKSQIENRVHLAEKNVESARKMYEPLITSQAARAAYDAFVLAWQNYLAECAKMLAISSKGDNAEAMNLFVTDISAVGLKAETTLEKMVELDLVGADTAEKAGNDLYLNSRNLVVGAIGLATLFAFVAGYFLTASVARPVTGMTEAMTKLATGDIEATIPAIGQVDEIGRMAAAVLVFKQQAVESRRQAEREKMAEREAAESRRQALLDMANTVELETTGAVESIAANARQVDSAAQEMSRFAESVSLDTQSVAAAAEEALANAQTVSSAADQLSASIQEITAHITRTAEITQRAVVSGETAAGTVRSLTQAVTKISDVTKLIGNIASQTNLLALNATIESARAGEAGRGFAVVAAEVKNLASQTARSTEDIDRQIMEIQAVTQAAVKAMAEVGDRIQEIDGAATAIAGAIEQQGASTREIARNVSQTTAAALEVSARIQNVSTDAEQVDGRAKNVRASIGEVTDKIGGLREILVSVVRASTEDANRQGAPRYKAAG